VDSVRLHPHTSFALGVGKLALEFALSSIKASSRSAASQPRAQQGREIA